MAAAVLLTACGHKSDTHSSQSSESTLPVITRPKDSGPVLDTTGTNYQAIINSISVYDAWLFAHPDSSKAGEIYAPYSVASSRAISRLNDLKTSGQYVQDNPATYSNAKLKQQINPDEVLVTVNANVPTSITKNSKGSVVTTEPSHTLQVDFTLQRGADGHWRVSDAEQTGSQS